MTKMSNLVARADRTLSPVSGHYTQLEVVKGEGCFLISNTGERYLDFSSGIGVCSTGHCHPEVVHAIQSQAGTLIHGCIGVVYYEPPIALAEKLGQILGNGLNSVFFTQSGSEAMESAIKLAKYVTKKHKLIAFKGGFHGRTLGALSITSSKEKYREGYAPLLEGVSFFPYPYTYRCPFGGETLEESTTRSIAALKDFFAQLDDEVAAVIIEPILGEGGYIAAPQPFLKVLSELCKERNILLIFDEIQTGIMKTGSWFVFQELGIVPDIITVAKGIGSGMPLGACVSTQALMSKWTRSAHGGTYGGNPVTCAAGLATLNVLEKYQDHVKKLGQIALDFLNQNLQDHPLVGDVRGYGLLLALEFVKDRASKAPNPEIISGIIQACLDEKLIVISCGVEDNVIRLIPPLVIDQETLVEGLRRLVKVINATH